MDKKEKIMELLSQLSEEELKEVLGNTPNKKRRRGRGKRKSGNTKKVNDSTNKFEEIYSSLKFSDSELAELKVAEETDKVSKLNPLRGGRAPANKVKVRCDKCSNKFNIVPSLVQNAARWTCNDCLTGRR
jgi:hypothetical protein|tara:strand:- start:20424 stop:20813 length:390 start_codon:yes stop_codon:yes gene_type:complete